MKHTGRLPSVLLALCLALGVAAWSAQGARAEASGVDYVGADGRTYNTATDGIEGNDAPTPITLDKKGFLPAGWYVVDDTLEYNDESAPDKRLKFEGTDVHIILADDCTLTAPGGSTLVLAVYDGTGRLDFVRSATLDRDCIDAPPTELLEFHFDRTREPFRLMLLDGKTYAPLCEARTD